MQIAMLTQVRVIDSHEVFEQLVDLLRGPDLRIVDLLHHYGLVVADSKSLHPVFHIFRPRLIAGRCNVCWNWMFTQPITLIVRFCR